MINITKNDLAGAIVSYIAIFRPGLSRASSSHFGSCCESARVSRECFEVLTLCTRIDHFGSVDVAFVTAGFLGFQSPLFWEVPCGPSNMLLAIGSRLNMMLISIFICILCVSILM